ncbi:hypothetical protein H5410_052189 [Solanum commersonii]|uniref:Uncharacterized protein n=1 Tax=Solanum commersonii TaxID=4109 RepID=A0A9J5X0R2_SOLCO|nr:hypothetical protein H5410_052189 [Solanum commersonii]
MEESCRSDSPLSSESCIDVLTRSNSGESSSLIIENFKHDLVQTGNVTTYLEFIIQGDGKIDHDVTLHVDVGLMRWMLAYGVLSDD